ncbi:MAG: SUMF1/EgtB/PvdO family nonheme iron enzyme [Anaerolineae bacterium]|nr:SUMF1/EgtB/PvdO family nonheme iron enzyme [Anaerolineae bacterium]
MMDYLDFDLEINPGSGRMYPVVARSPAGDARETMYFPFSELELENKLLTLENALLRSGGALRRVLSKELQAVQDFGRELFDALLLRKVGECYTMSLRDAALQGKGLRLKLRINTPQLAALPWEFLFDAGRAGYVCLSQNTPVVRYLEVLHPLRPLTVAPPLRILAMIASPSDQHPLNVELEKQRVETALDDLRAGGLVELIWLEGQTWRHLQRAMRHGPWHIFHFVGHGDYDPATEEGLIALADERGRTYCLHATQLGHLLANRDLRLVVLNACAGAKGSTRDLFSSTAATLVQRGLPAVLAMQYAITDRAAIECARTFYEALADGLPVDAAVVEARVAINLTVPNSVEWGTPVLYTRAPDGVLFRMEEVGVKTQRSEGAEERRSEGAEEQRSRGVEEQERAWAREVVRRREAFEPELVVIPAGEFLMGSDPERDKNVYEDEQPQHGLYLPAYAIGKTPVTNAQYAAFVAAAGYRVPRHWENGKPPQGKEQHPVVDVTWHDALAYCRWLAEMTGKAYMLPSEAEWEKAASWAEAQESGGAEVQGGKGAGKKRIWPWGDTPPTPEFCNFDNHVKDTTPVGAYSPRGNSAYGCVDMAGNVWEWTRSVFKAYPYDPADGREDLEAGDDVPRVLRGGAFYSNVNAARCAYRCRNNPDNHGDGYGFRVVMGASPFSLSLDSGASEL